MAKPMWGQKPERQPVKKPRNTVVQDAAPRASGRRAADLPGFRARLESCVTDLGGRAKTVAALNIGVRTVAGWLGPEPHVPDLAALADIAKCTGVSAHWLIFGRGPREAAKLSRVDASQDLAETLAAHVAERVADLRGLQAHELRGVGALILADTVARAVEQFDRDVARQRELRGELAAHGDASTVYSALIEHLPTLHGATLKARGTQELVAELQGLRARANDRNRAQTGERLRVWFTQDAAARDAEEQYLWPSPKRGARRAATVLELPNVLRFLADKKTRNDGPHSGP